MRSGPIDILFNCAGFVHHGTVLTTSDADWDFSFDLNVKSMHRTIRAFLLGMLKKGGGSIVNTIASKARLLGARHPQPLRLWRLEGRGHRPHQIGGGRLHPPGCAATPFAQAPSRARRSMAGCKTLSKSSGQSLGERPLEPSSTAKPMGQAFRQAGGDRRALPSTSPPTSAPSTHRPSLSGRRRGLHSQGCLSSPINALNASQTRVNAPKR